jgi:hypothetical protein
VLTVHSRYVVISVFLVFLLHGIVQPARAQQHEQTSVDAAQREAVVASVVTLLQAHYIFPDVAEQCARHIMLRLADGAYDGMTEPYEFAEALTTDLRSISKDGHMNVNLYPFGAFNEKDPVEIELARERDLLASKRDNFAFRRLEWLPGNVVVLELRSFRHTKDAGPTAIAAMNFLANADAIIIDLRSNHGGDPTMIQLISSYFFDKPTHLNSFQMRDKANVDQFWTLPHVPGPKLVNTPLFLLTGWYTYSAAEEFAYNMQALKRATLVGNKTGGGAHPTHNYKIDDRFAVSIPFARAVNPVTGTNWEGVGVEPDILVEAEGFKPGQTIAHLEALKAIEPTLEDGWYRDSIQLLIVELQSEMENAP